MVLALELRFLSNRCGLGHQANSSLTLETNLRDKACQLSTDCVVIVGLSRKDSTSASTCYNDVYSVP